jgi:DNA mismatch repair protein MutH
MSQTITECYEKFIPFIGKEYILPTTKHKGLPGHFLEELLGIPHTNNCLDCIDGELKLFPVKKLKNRTLVPKETMAITMLSTDELLTNDFKSSKCYKKISRMLIIPYYRNKDSIWFMKAKIIDRECIEFADLYNTIEYDYNEIRKNYIENGILQSKNGKLLQNRTKGAGHGSTSRAFYLRQEFMKQCITLNNSL